MKFSVEFRERRVQGDWFVRIVAGRHSFSKIAPTREQAIRAVSWGIRWILRRP